MSTSSEYILRLRRIDPAEVLPEEVVFTRDPDHPFLYPGDLPEPYRTQYIAFARLQPILQQEKPTLVTFP